MIELEVRYDFTYQGERLIAARMRVVDVNRPFCYVHPREPEVDEDEAAYLASSGGEYHDRLPRYDVTIDG